MCIKEIWSHGKDLEIFKVNEIGSCKANILHACVKMGALVGNKHRSILLLFFSSLVNYLTFLLSNCFPLT